MSRSLIVAAFVAALAAGLWLHPTSHRFLVSHAYNNLGALYAGGTFGADARPQSLAWFRRAADLGSAAAAFNLGFAYQTGLGTAVDEAEAMRWYERATQAGSAIAANNLAMLYANPSHGRPRMALARMWMLRARSLDDGSLKRTIDESLAAMEHDMNAQQLAASEDPERAARLDAPSRPRAPTHLSDEEIQRQVTGGLAAAAPLRAATDEYIHAHHQLPTADAVARDARFDPIDGATTRVSLGTGAMVQVTLRGGPYDGEEVGWIPMLRAGQLAWICAHGHVPVRYFDSSCR